MRGSLLCLLLILLALWYAAPSWREGATAAVESGQEPAAVADRLTGDCPRVWVYGGYSSYLEEGNCSGSDAWTFHPDNRLVIRKCREKRVVTEEKRWGVERKPGGINLKVDEDEFNLSFVTEDSPSKRVKLTLTPITVREGEMKKRWVFYRYRELE
jgi:hypothetical protein